MTPQEKAMQLISKFVSLGFTLWVSKQCALIAVDELIQAIRFTDAKSDLGYVGYWKEVKQEIELL